MLIYCFVDSSSVHSQMNLSEELIEKTAQSNKELPTSEDDPDHAMENGLEDGDDQPARRQHVICNDDEMMNNDSEEVDNVNQNLVCDNDKVTAECGMLVNTEHAGVLNVL